jgi:phosphatidylinositol-3,4,5-trisphosphate 3-phosphatase/dual-specificity protein phosphatase PTEN
MLDPVASQAADFDLDLTYCTDTIIAMGWPAESYFEGSVRNRMADVERLLSTRHFIGQGKAMVYNLCSERSYEREDIRFVGIDGLSQWRRHPFPDHQAPPLELMCEFCDSAAKFLKQDPSHVRTLRCELFDAHLSVEFSLTV